MEDNNGMPVEDQSSAASTSAHRLDDPDLDASTTTTHKRPREGDEAGEGAYGDQGIDGEVVS